MNAVGLQHSQQQQQCTTATYTVHPSTTSTHTLTNNTHHISYTKKFNVTYIIIIYIIIYNI